MKNLCVKLIEFYQKSMSPLKPQCCRFDPVCSRYAKQAFLRHGFFWGIVLSAYRILRCNPLCRPGYDPVPDLNPFQAIKVKITKITKIFENKKHKKFKKI